MARTKANIVDKTVDALIEAEGLPTPQMLKAGENYALMKMFKNQYGVLLVKITEDKLSLIREMSQVIIDSGYSYNDVKVFYPRADNTYNMKQITETITNEIFKVTQGKQYMEYIMEGSLNGLESSISYYEELGELDPPKGVRLIKQFEGMYLIALDDDFVKHYNSVMVNTQDAKEFLRIIQGKRREA